MKYNVKRIVALGMLVALEIVLSRFLSIATPLFKIGFAFLPIMIAAMLYGPLWAGAVGAVADILGATLFPINPYFPGFTLTAFIIGAIYGVFLYGKKTTWLNASTAAVTVCVGANMLLNSYWLYIMMGNAVIAGLPTRIINNTVMIVVQILFILLFARVGRVLIEQVVDEKLDMLRAKARGYFVSNPQLRESISDAIAKKCFSLPEYEAARTVFCFVGTDKEIDTRAILERVLLDKKKLCVPLSDRDSVMTAREINTLDELNRVGLYGILVPPTESAIILPEDIDITFVPCSAVDKRRCRVGKGGRYYDRYLKDTAMVKIGLCPDALVQRKLPRRGHDVPVDRVVTETRIY